MTTQTAARVPITNQAPTHRLRTLSDPAYQAFLLLRTAFVLAPVVFAWTSSSTSSPTGIATSHRRSTASPREAPIR